MPITLKTAQIRFKQSDNTYSTVVDMFSDNTVGDAVSEILRSRDDSIEAIEGIVSQYQNLITDFQSAINSISDIETQLATNTLHLTVQNLTSSQKAQIKANLGIVENDWSGSVKYDRQQTLTDNQKLQARTNIGLEDVFDLINNSVKYTQAQSLTTAQKLLAQKNIGLDDLDSLVSDVVKYNSSQTLTAAQKAQAQQNIGLDNLDSLISGVVKYNQNQELTPEQKSIVQENIGLSNINSLVTGTVKYDSAQSLSSQQKNQARTNIGAAASNDVQNNAVLYSGAQSLTDTQKAQARGNINAASSSQINAINTNISSLQTAVDSYGNAVEDVTKNQTGLTINYINGTSTNIEIETDALTFDGGYVDENNCLHLTYDNEEVEGFTPVQLPATGGSGAAVGGTVTITRITDASIDIVYGDSAQIQFTFTALDSSGDMVGAGTGTWYVGGVAVARNVTIAQGNNSYDISPYLTAGNNNVRLSISVDTGGTVNQTASKTWTVNAVDMRFTWGYDNSQINTAAFIDRWIPYGNIEKTTHTTVDGVELPTSSTLRSGSPQNMTIPMQTHGAHAIERWLSATIGNTTKTTPSQYHSAIFVEEGNMTPIVAISLKNSTIKQYNTIKIPVVVYNPASIITDATLSIDGTQVGAWTDIDRSVQYWNYTPATSGTHVLSITCGTVTASVTLTVEAISMNISEVSGYSYKFKASDMASNNAVKNWSSGTSSNPVTATFSQNFDWINGGLHTELDENDNVQQYLCIKAGTTMTINHRLFATDPKRNGMSFKMIFKVKNVRNYDAQIAHCYTDGIGLRMYAHNSIFSSSGTSINVPYGEDEYIELEFDIYPTPVIENDGNYRYIMAWIDGVITSCRVYGDSDNFVQPNGSQENLVIGSNDCDIYIYMIKAYPMIISRDNHIDNFIMDAPNAGEMTARYKRNDILDSETNEISYEKLMENNRDCRIWLYDIPYMTNDKSDKVDGCTFQQFWANGDASHQLSGTGKVSVQGTSSVKYIRGAANTDINFTSLTDQSGRNLMANGTKDQTYGNNWYFEDSENRKHAKVFTVEQARTNAGISEDDPLGPEWVVVERDQNKNPTKYIKALGYKINDTSCPITYSNTKVNFASCEQVNNMCNAMWYQRFNPYPSLTARDCMEFNIGVQFIKDSGTIPDDAHFVLWGDNKYHMYSIANMGNSKKNVHVFHDLSNANQVCIEVNDNDKDQMRMVSDDLSSEDWSGDVFFGMRYPDTKNPSQEIRNAWQRLVSWMASRNPGAYTNQRLSSPETYDVYTFRGHNREGLQVLKGTTVKKYAGTYTRDTFQRRMAKMLSECEDYMVMDSFVYHFLFLERHTMVDNVSKNNFWSSTDLIHWDLSKAYDMDTSDGNNNQGQLVFDYGNEYNDDIGGMKVYNGADSVWFIFVANLYEACRTMFINREAEGAWSATAYHNFLLEQQRKVPERCWVQTYWYDYLRTYEQGISTEWMTFLDGGQKTHQRKHFEFFEELYDSSKYRGAVSTSQNVNFRAYTPNTWAGVEPKGELTVKMYNKMYISVDVGTTQLAPIKAQRGVATTIDFSSGGTLNNTLIVINTAPMIQEISGMQQLYPDTCVFSMATRLRELTIGSTEQGYSNTFLKSLALENNTLLERLYVQNLPNANSVLNLSHCPSLLEIDATGSGFTGYEFANGGLLNKAILNKPSSLTMINLSDLTDNNFTILDYTALTSLRAENLPNIDILLLCLQATALQILRITGVNWSFENTDILDSFYRMQGIDDNGYTIDKSVLAGDAHISTIRMRSLVNYTEAWPNLKVTYDSTIPQYMVSFVNSDGTPIKDRYGVDYIQYVDTGDTAYDPVEAGQIDPPTLPADEHYTYTFSGWNGLNFPVLNDRTVNAKYTATVNTYTVRWFTQPNTLPLKTVTDIPYGSQAVYNAENPYDFPTLQDEESSYIFKLFKGWDKSTGYITQNLDVYAVWGRAALPLPGTIELKDMTPQQINSVAKASDTVYKNETQKYITSDFWEEKDYVDIRLGEEFNFTNVRSFEVANQLYLDGTEIIQPVDPDTGEKIQLFTADAPSFTLAIDFEFQSTATDSVLACCFEEEGSEGFSLRYSSRPDILWGNAHTFVGNAYYRGITVLRHVAGSNILTVNSDNVGNYTYTTDALYSSMYRTRATQTEAYLTFGGIPVNNTFVNPGQGWIHWCKIWYDDLGPTVAATIANLPKQVYRMEYCGPHRYKLESDVSKYCAASFISNNLNDYTLRMNTSATNAGGWDGSEVVRPFYNNRIFKSFPICWQAMIATVLIPSNAGYRSHEIINSHDRIYMPSYVEMIAVTSSPYVSEGSHISFYPTNPSRVKFRGELIIGEDSQLITAPSDPTLLSEYTVKQGDRWVNTNENNRVLYYIDQDTGYKHAHFGNTVLANMIAAQGAQGGFWVTTNHRHTRSARQADTYEFILIHYYGSATQASAANSYAYEICFSI